MRNIERLVTGACFAGSMLAGIEHMPQWLLLTPVCFFGLVFAEDRAVRQRMGTRSWPSVGYARFLFGTNVYLATRNTAFSAALFALASTGTSLLHV